MHKKGGMSESLSLIISIIIGLTIFLGFASCILRTLQPEPDVRAPVLYEQFIQYYRACVNQPVTDCYCDSFEFSLLQPTEVIKLQQLADNTISIELWKKDGTAPVKTTVVEGKQLCTAYFTHYGTTLTKKPVDTHTILLDASYAEYNYFLILYQDATQACFINQARGSLLGGEPSDFLYKHTPSSVYSRSVVEELLSKYLVSCKDKQKQQPSQEQPDDPDDLF